MAACHHGEFEEGFFFLPQLYKPTDHYNDKENKYAVKLTMLNYQWSGVSRAELFTSSSPFLTFKLSRILGDAKLLDRRQPLRDN